MITRLEIDGFKSFQNFTIDFEPFHVIAGANASGKSNIFDALRLLSLLSVKSPDDALFDTSLRGDAIYQFTKINNSDYSNEISIKAEFLLENIVVDDFGQKRKLKKRRLRYEIILHRLESEVWIEYERLFVITSKNDEWLKKYSKEEKIIKEYETKTRSTNYIYKSSSSLLRENETMYFALAGENGKPRLKINAHDNYYISKSMLSQVSDINYTHAFAIKKELEYWRFLQLKPEKIRLPSSQFQKNSIISEEGKGVAGFLYQSKLNENFIINDISRDLSGMIPGIKSVDVEKDIGGNVVGKVILDDNVEHYFSTLSEGTLRMIALSVFKRDLSSPRVIFFEEPENGIHPSRLDDLVLLFKGMFTDFFESDFNEFPLRQVIVNTHSPILVSNIINNQEVFGQQKAGLSLLEMVTKIKDGKSLKCSKASTIPIELNENKSIYALSNKVLLVKLKRLLASNGLKTSIDNLNN